MAVDGEPTALAVLARQQNAVIAQEKVVEKAVEEDHRPAAFLGQFECSAPAELPAGAVGVKALLAVKVQLRSAVDAPHAVKEFHVHDGLITALRVIRVGVAAGGKAQAEQQHWDKHKDLFHRSFSSRGRYAIF